MKTEHEHKITNKVETFPKLMFEGRYKDTIIFVTAKTLRGYEGFVVSSKDEIREIGYFYNAWYDLHDFHGTVTLISE